MERKYFLYLIPPTYSAVLEALTLLSASQLVLLGKNWFSQRVGRPDSTRDSTSRFTNGSSGLPVWRQSLEHKFGKGEVFL